MVSSSAPRQGNTPEEDQNIPFYSVHFGLSLTEKGDICKCFRNRNSDIEECKNWKSDKNCRTKDRCVAPKTCRSQTCGVPTSQQFHTFGYDPCCSWEHLRARNHNRKKEKSKRREFKVKPAMKECNMLTLAKLQLGLKRYMG